MKIKDAADGGRDLPERVMCKEKHLSRRAARFIYLSACSICHLTRWELLPQKRNTRSALRGPFPSSSYLPFAFIIPFRQDNICFGVHLRNAGSPNPPASINTAARARAPAAAEHAPCSLPPPCRISHWHKQNAGRVGGLVWNVMLTHEYSWHDAICLAHSSEGCGAAGTGGQEKVK